MTCARREIPPRNVAPDLNPESSSSSLDFDDDEDDVTTTARVGRSDGGRRRGCSSSDSVSGSLFFRVAGEYLLFATRVFRVVGFGVATEASSFSSLRRTVKFEVDRLRESPILGGDDVSGACVVHRFCCKTIFDQHQQKTSPSFSQT